MIQIDSKSGKFSFDADIDSLQKAVSRVQAAVAAAGSAGVKDFIIACYKKKIYLIGLSTDTYVCLNMPVKVLEATDGALAIDLASLSGIIKGRAQLNLAFNQNGCTFKALKGTYKGSFNVGAVTEDQAKIVNTYSAGKTGSASKLTSELLALIRAGFTSTSIKDVYAEASVFTYMTLDLKGILQVFAADRHHFAHFKCNTGIKDQEVKIALPGSHLQLIDKVTEGEDCQFYISDQSLRVTGKGFLLVLPSLQTEEKFFQLVPQQLKSTSDQQFSAPVDLARLKTLSANLGALYSNNAVLLFSCTKTSLSLKLSTAAGSASESIKLEGTGASLEAAIDPKLFDDLCRVMPQGESLMEIKPKAWIKFTVKAKDRVLTFVSSTQKG